MPAINIEENRLRRNTRPLETSHLSDHLPVDGRPLCRWTTGLKRLGATIIDLARPILFFFLFFFIYAFDYFSLLFFYYYNDLFLERKIPKRKGILEGKKIIS